MEHENSRGKVSDKSLLSQYPSRESFRGTLSLCVDLTCCIMMIFVMMFSWGDSLGEQQIVLRIFITKGNIEEIGKKWRM